MKKNLLLTIIILILLVSFGCSNTPAPQTDATSSTPEPSSSLSGAYCELTPYRAYDIETFLSDWDRVRTDTVERKPSDSLYYLELTAEITSTLVIPVLRSDDYKLCLIEADSYYYWYHYAPVNNYPYPGHWDFDISVMVIPNMESLTKALRFFKAEHETVIDDTFFYSHVGECWVYYDNGTAVAIHGLTKRDVENVDDLKHYFTFTTYSGDGQIDDFLLSSHTSADMGTFLNEWTQAKSDATANTVMSHAAKQNNMIIPVLQNDDYKLLYIETFANKYRYYYVPSDHTSDQLPSTFLSVYVYTDGLTFAEAVDASIMGCGLWDIEPENGIAYSGTDNRWILDKSGFVVIIEFGDVDCHDLQTLDQYFTFETYPADDNLETE